MKPSIYAIAKALIQQHNFVYDVAFLSAWYHHRNDRPAATLFQVEARIRQVKNTPIVDEASAEKMLESYRKRLKQPITRNLT